ncbi:hypothetical protein [Algibacter sp. 2305UL17-15]|uniref:hypothetical protein n=1 Tax=Algibacter sp. 2305UL17-15 TaxID=3231268 RepID=UPI0034582A2C
MTPEKEMTLKFYQNIGKLFYAIAAIDNVPQKEESDVLKDIIKKKWVKLAPIEDGYCTDAANQIEIIFDWLNNENKPCAQSCFRDFVSFKNEQNHLFSFKTKKKILKTAHAITKSFSGEDKSELMLLAKLDIELRKMRVVKDPSIKNEKMSH